MVTKEKLVGLRSALRRLFSLKVTSTTLHEVRNLIATELNGNEQSTQDFLQILYSGRAKKGTVGETEEPILRKLVDEYAPLIRLAKDVAERGPFLSMIMHDTADAQGNPVFMNRVKRVDGEIFDFTTDVSSTLHIVQHFLDEALQALQFEKGKASLKEQKQALELISQKIDQLKQGAS